MSKDDDKDDDKEWKSSHDRFVETLERFTSKMERDQAKNERIANGFYVEVSRKELREHLDAQALHYNEEAFKLTEQGIQIPAEYKLADGSIIESAKLVLERSHAQLIEGLNNKAKSFSFFAAHLPEGKETFILDMQMCVSLELVR
jgi:hypothetical protein